ncbi:hypothetical protein ABZW11_15705 [Nonomuraea sp. NPDC004580]|uniref:hypothetical protein n=1 Tax=Nonomuraea sp. NPDC004580 TaxID=3154552 RepID=UPI0033A3307B
MEFHAWSDGLALRPRDYLGMGEPLAAVVRAAGPLTGEWLYLFALGTATTMARLHLGGIAGLRLSPANVLISPQGEAIFAPGPRDSLFPGHDVGDWAGVVVFAATGRLPDDGADLDRLPPALRAVIDECRRPDPGARPSAVDLVRILLGHPGRHPGRHPRRHVGRRRGGSVHELLLAAERRTMPYERVRHPEPPPPEPLWRRRAYLAGLAIGVLAVAVAAGVVILVSGGERRAATDDLVDAMGARTATFRHVSGVTVAEGRLSFDGAASTAYAMKLTCGNAPAPVAVSLVGSRGVAGGAAFDTARPPNEPCAQQQAPGVRELSSPYTIKALLDAAGTGVTSRPAEGGGRVLTGSALAHRVRGEENAASFAGVGAEGPVRFTVQVDDAGLPVRLRLRMESRAAGPRVVETVYRDWRAYEDIKEGPHG